jgi:enoyl-CoA hydratase
VATRLSATEHNGILLVTLESDDGFPRLERAILSELQEKAANLAAAPYLAGAVITGTERAFATGAEITEIAKLTAASAFEFARHGQSVVRTIANSPKPVVAAIRGYCMGGGFDLALACTARIAATDAVFAHPGGSIGIITGWGGTQQLPRLIGRSTALEMLVTGRKVDASEAYDLGLVSKIVAANVVVKEAIHTARVIASRLSSTRR